MGLREKKTTTRDMTEGVIAKQILLFALPLMVGNIFQMLYNTVDSIIVGNFVGTQALAAVGSTTMITNMAVFFFNGFSVGAGVIIGRSFGAKDFDRLHRAIETTIAVTVIFSILFTIIGINGVDFMLRFMSTPADVFEQATVYLKLYFAGIAGLLFYNMGSGILRAVGDTKRPLYFLMLTSVMNIFLDLLFVLVFHMGISGVALATILSQLVSAVLVLMLLIKTRDIYRLTLHDLRIDGGLLGEIFAVGLPTAIQSVITAFSNVFVQSYINYFGSTVMAGWACYNKIDSFIMLPMSSMSMACTTFVSQNIGAKKLHRANEGTKTSIYMTLGITGVLATLIWVFAKVSIEMFTQDVGVIETGAMFLRYNVYFILGNCVTHVLAGGLRGRGDSTGPMVIMLIGFVALRQAYLYVITHYVANTMILVGFGYPVGWMSACILEVTYYKLRWGKQVHDEEVGVVG